MDVWNVEKWNDESGARYIGDCILGWVENVVYGVTENISHIGKKYQ